MFASLRYLVLLALLAPTSGLPISDSPDANGKPIKNVDCNGHIFTREQIVATKTEMQRVGGLVPARNFPHVYGNAEGLFGSPNRLWEFPLMSPIYTPAVDAGAYRVITNDAYNYQGCIYHIPGGSFKKCV